MSAIERGMIECERKAALQIEYPKNFDFRKWSTKSFEMIWTTS